MLDVTELCASYGGMHALHGVSLSVAEGEIVAVIGSNGAGKSTLLKCISGWHRPDSGEIVLWGKRIQGVPAHVVSSAGVALVPEGRRLFPRLSVRDNLQLGAYAYRKERDRYSRLALVFALFPRLAERLDQRAETLSGGEQQMVAIGRALMSRPKLLMLDEPSQGIMPRLVDTIFEAVRRIREEGTTVFLVEQRLVECLEIADRAYVMQSGRIVLAGSAREVASNEEVRRAYLGV